MIESIKIQMPAACRAAIDDAVSAIPPAWPLDATVAVNPYLGQAHESLAEAGARLARVGGMRVTLPRSWFAKRVAQGVITDSDLAAACLAATANAPVSAAELNAALVSAHRQAQPAAIPTVADLAAPILDIETPELVAERIGFWAAGFFDRGQALWAASRDDSAFHHWRAFATRDLTPEIIGLRGFAAHVDAAPATAEAAIVRAVHTLGLAESALPTYFHSLLLSLGGWAQLGRHELWQAELAGGTDSTLEELLAIRLVWEEALYLQCGDAIRSDWAAATAAHAAPLQPDRDLLIDSILQEAAERAEQRRLGELLAAPATPPTDDARPTLQAAFCIDVRSEVFRRALEAVDPAICTLGFAGFFGLGTRHHAFASDVPEKRLPVLLNPGFDSQCDIAPETDLAARYLARAKRAWGRFKLAAVSSFAFVESAGPLYAGKLLHDAFGMTPADPAATPRPVPADSVDLAARVQTAAGVLGAMSLAEGPFAPVVLLLGHGAAVVNNPHASALQCGACGGYSGEVNARLLAGLLNEPAVRAGLVERGIRIPDDTLFVAGLHDTTSDTVTLFDNDAPSAAHAAALAQAQSWLQTAAMHARAERAKRLPRATDAASLLKRGRDWSEVRPEWALAGCRAFIAAPRQRTRGRNLQGEAFLHDYNWRADSEFAVLELIMTAPVVVASWISLQYYGSVVAPRHFGGGNKLLHNVVGGIGVFEGNGGLLRAGLPWQSVHDGNTLRHEPLRLSVCIEAPREAMSAILEKHPAVRALFDNRWLHLFALDDRGAMAWRYAGNLDWVA